MLKKTLTNKQIVERIERVIAQSMMATYTRSVKLLLTWKYLGVQSGTLRNETNAMSEGNTAYLGTIPWYGHAYETGNWDRWKGREGNKKAWKRSRKATWSGNKKHRPFMKDTIRDKRNTANVARRVRIKLKNEGIMR
jgi:hypothetical protein